MMDDATLWMRVLGALALLAPFAFGCIAPLRPYARRIGLVAMLLYLAVGIGFVVWYTLIRPGPG
jgi:hypothetical protein